MPEFAKQITVERKAGRYALKIDGDEFPWFVDEAINVDFVRGACPTVTLKIFAAQQIEVVGHKAPTSGRNAPRD